MLSTTNMCLLFSLSSQYMKPASFPCITLKLYLHPAAYLGHFTFNWAELAAKTAAGGNKRPGDTKGRTDKPTNVPIFKEPSLLRPKRPGRERVLPVDKAPAGSPASSAPGRNGSAPSGVHTTAVTNPEYLLPTSREESGVHWTTRVGSACVPWHPIFITIQMCCRMQQCSLRFQYTCSVAMQRHCCTYVFAWTWFISWSGMLHCFFCRAQCANPATTPHTSRWPVSTRVLARAWLVLRRLSTRMPLAPILWGWRSHK